MHPRVFDVRDGARPQGRPSFNAASLAPDGRVWFATGIAVQVVDPRILSQTALPAQTYVESVVVDRRHVAAYADLNCAPHPREVQIDYTSPTFADPQKVNFRYRLDNYDRDWHEAATRRQAFYADLPPGTYTFRVIAANRDGVWNEAGATLAFSVAPAYYQTTWFRVVSAVAFVALPWGAHRYRLRRLKHAFVRTLEARVGERTRIARELHDTLLQSFHGVLLRFQTASYLLPERPAQAKEKLDDAIEQAARAITEGRDAVQGLRASTLERNDLAKAIRTLGDELVANASDHPPSDFHVVVEGEPRDLHPIVRDEIYKIHGGGPSQRLSACTCGTRRSRDPLRRRAVSLRVRDDGKGIDGAVLARQGINGHYGLRGMPERAALIGGKLAVWSEVGAGTEVEMRLPASSVYATSARRSRWSRFLAPKTAVHERRLMSVAAPGFVLSPSTIIRWCARGSPVWWTFSRSGARGGRSLSREVPFPSPARERSAADASGTSRVVPDRGHERQARR